jgi:hypothetical protein
MCIRTIFRSALFLPLLPGFAHSESPPGQTDEAAAPVASETPAPTEPKETELLVSFDDTPPEQIPIEKFNQAIDALTPSTCQPQLQHLFDYLYQVEPTNILINDKSAADHLVQRAFHASQNLHNKRRAFYKDGELSEECLNAMRRGDLALRYLADYVYERIPTLQPWRTESDTKPATFDPSQIRSGDLLVTRATALSSAGIGHFGLFDTQFSHNAMVYIEPGTQKAYTVEAYLEFGGKVQPLEKFLKKKHLGRVVVMRPDNPEVAIKGLSQAFTRIKKGKNIPYDEAFDDQDHTELFCSEIAQWVYDLAGDGGAYPLYKSVLSSDERPLFDTLNIQRGDLSAPSDFLIDPQFQMVAEWRDIQQLAKMRRHDAVVERLLRWHQQGEAEIKATPGEARFVKFGRSLRRVPLLGLLLKNKVHPKGDLDFMIPSYAMLNIATDVDEALLELLAGKQEVSFRELHALTDTLKSAAQRNTE